MNVKELCPELETLSTTLRRLGWDLEKELQNAVLQKIENPLFNLVGLDE